MCIIVSKPRGEDVPSKETLRRCFTGNKDGAGFMYEAEGKVWVDKGYMTFESFYKRLGELEFAGVISKENNVVMHFRIATEGSVRKGTCHPFPISSSLNMLNKEKLSTDIAMAHNGIIPIKVETEDFSDTQEFIYRVISKPEVKKGLKEQCAEAHSVIKDGGGISKFCILTPSSMVRLGGDWEKEDGVYYSNKSYKPYVYEAPKKYTPSVYRGVWSDEEELADYIDEIVTKYFESVMTNGFDHWDAVEAMAKKYTEKLKVTYLGRRKYDYGCGY